MIYIQVKRYAEDNPVGRPAVQQFVGSLNERKAKKATAAKNEDGQASVDNRQAVGETDAALGDANNIISGNANMHGRLGGGSTNYGILGTQSTCTNYTVDATKDNMGILTINFNGATCDDRSRTGKILLTIQNYASGVRWKHVNAVLQVDYINYKVTRTSDGKSIELNGTQLLTNISGGTWYDLIFLGQAS